MSGRVLGQNNGFALQILHILNIAITGQKVKFTRRCTCDLHIQAGLIIDGDGYQIGADAVYFACLERHVAVLGTLEGLNIEINVMLLVEALFMGNDKRNGVDRRQQAKC
ncbi:hypothetical protein D3C72_2059080 [compost metagenome]